MKTFKTSTKLKKIKNQMDKKTGEELKELQQKYLKEWKKLHAK